ncbi:hypothetical protein WCLP8_4270006 [uncultured Gammaproteobacteria bacterium]
MRSPPKQLTLKHLDAMIADSRYRNPSHPEHAPWIDLVAKGFKTLFPGPVRRDETGRPLDSIANDGANENRRPARMPDTMFRLIKGEAAPITSEKTLSAMRENSGVESTHSLNQSGMVHVRAYTRVQDGTQVEVSEYDRTASAQSAANQDNATQTPDDKRSQASVPDNGKTDTPPGGDGQNPLGPNADVASAADCEYQFAIDNARCRTLPNNILRQQCWANAMQRYAACLHGGFLPPLFPR